MKGFIIGFITAIIILAGAAVVVNLSEDKNATEIMEGSEAVEFFNEFTEDVYDYINDIVEA